MGSGQIFFQCLKDSCGTQDGEPVILGSKLREGGEMFLFYGDISRTSHSDL